MSRNRCWCFTINNYTESDWFSVKHLFKRAKFGICGEEVGTKEGTEHLQGYVSLNSPCSLKIMKQYLARAHLTVANGSDQENLVYCSKDATNLYQVGEPSEGQGKRNDIHDMVSKIKNKEATILDIMFDYPELYLRYSRSIKEYFNIMLQPRTTLPKVFWRWGLAGTGKTRFPVEKHPSHYIKDNTIWWDRYDQQEAIIIDDFDNTIPYRVLLRLIDRYEYLGQTKGSYVHINSPYIYITCEHPPEFYWQGNELAQVMRRLESVTEIKMDKQKKIDCFTFTTSVQV